MNNTAVNYVLLTGQDDNIGDSLLRRPLLRVVRTAGPCFVYIGKNGPGYINNLELDASDKVFRSKALWTISLAASSLKRKTNLVLNAGELTPNIKSTLGKVPLFAILPLLNIHNGAVIHSGLGLRRSQSPKLRTIRLFAKASTVVSWRDEFSMKAINQGNTAPDWAFYEGTPIQSLQESEFPAKPNLILSLRGDRPAPTEDTVLRIRTFLEETGATATVVCQVARDSARAEWLSDKLDARLANWADPYDHREQELRLRELYRQATWVASDRLHVIVAAITEGAIPIDLAPDTGSKVERTLREAGFQLHPAAGPARDWEHLRRDNLVLLTKARQRLGALSESIISACSTPPEVSEHC